MSFINKEEVKKKVKLSDVFSGEGVEIKNDGEGYKCRWINHNHKDSSPSMGVSDEKGIFHCFGCGASGDVFNAVSILKPELDSFYQQLEYVHIKYEGNDVVVQVNKNKEEKSLNKDELYYELTDYICSFWQNCLGDDIKNKYLLGKNSISYAGSEGSHKMSGYGLDNNIVKNFRIGYAPNSKELYNKIIEKFGENIINKYLVDGKFLGLFNSRGVSLFKYRIVFPYIVDGEVEYFIARQTEYSPKKYDDGKYKCQGGSNNTFYNEDAFNSEYNHIYLTEGATDCLAMVKNDLPAIGVGSNGIKKVLLNRLVEKLDGKDVYIVFDNDKNGSGNKGALRLKQQLDELGIEVNIVTLPLPKEKDKIDINEFFLNHSREDFLELLRNILTNN